MKLDDGAASRKFELAVTAIAKGRIFFSGNDPKDEFNRGCDHVNGLLRDSHCLYRSGSFSTSVFLSITAIEEIAKLSIAVFRKTGTTTTANRHQDLLFNHRKKHSIALQEVIAIGTRLPEAIGEKRVRQLLDMAETGRLLKVREAALYTDNFDGRFICPMERIQKETARDILLLALEVWDDRLVGITEHTFEIDRHLAELFEGIAGS